MQKGTIIDNWAKGMQGIKGFIYAPAIVLTKWTTLEKQLFTGPLENNCSVEN